MSDNVTGRGASVQILNSTVAGTVSVNQPVGYPFQTPRGVVYSVPALVCGSQINGSLIVQGAPGRGAFPDDLEIGGFSCAAPRANTIGGTFVFQGNTALHPGSVHRIFDNTVAGPMICFANSPAPVGNYNVSPQKLGQCAGL